MGPLWVETLTLDMNLMLSQKPREAVPHFLSPQARPSLWLRPEPPITGGSQLSLP